MPALEPVIATLLANTSAFMGSMDAAKAQMSTLPQSAAVAGEDTGAALSTGAKDGARGLEQDLGTVGTDAGAALSSGLGAGVDDAEKKVKSGASGIKGMLDRKSVE